MSRRWFAGAVLHRGVVLVAVAAVADLAFAAVALACGAEALGGFDERERCEEEKRCEHGDGDAPESFAKWPADMRRKKATFPRVLGEVARGIDDEEELLWRAKAICYYIAVIWDIWSTNGAFQKRKTPPEGWR